MRFRDLNGGSNRDAGLDIAGWIPFEDRTLGQLIVFGQRETGADWRNHTSGSARFTELWMEEPSLVEGVFRSGSGQ